MLFCGKIFKAMLFVQQVEQTACSRHNIPKPAAQAACPSGDIKNALDFTHRVYAPLAPGITDIYAGLFNSQHVQTGTFNLGNKQADSTPSVWDVLYPPEPKAEEAASRGEHLAYSSPMIQPNAGGCWKHPGCGPYWWGDADRAAGMWAGCPGTDPGTATKHYLLRLSPSQHIRLLGQLSFNIPSGPDIRWLSFVWPYFGPLRAPGITWEQMLGKGAEGM